MESFFYFGIIFIFHFTEKKGGADAQARGVKAPIAVIRFAAAALTCAWVALMFDDTPCAAVLTSVKANQLVSV